MMEQDLFIRYKKNPTRELRNEIVEKHLYMVDILNMVDILIRKYLGKGVEYDDLCQVGALALVSAVERFDPEKGFEFSSFATSTTLEEIKKYFRDKQWNLKVPRRLKETAAKVQETKDALYAKYHRMSTAQEISQDTELSKEQIIEAMESSQAYGTYFLDKTFDDMGENGESPLLEKYASFVEEGYERVETSEIIKKVMANFSEQQLYICKQRFIYNRLQEEIVKALGVPQMTVSRTEKNIISMFKKRDGGADKKLDPLRAPKGAELKCIRRIKLMLP